MTPDELRKLANALVRGLTPEQRLAWVKKLRKDAQAAEPGPRTPEHMDEQQLRDYFDANVRHLPNATSHPFRIHAPGISLQSTSKERLWRFFREKVAGTRARTPSRAEMEDPNA